MQPKLIPLLPDLASFIYVVEEGSFTAAAHKLGVTPSALSKLVTRLEAALEVKLFQRTTRTLIITPAGQRVYEQSLVMVNAAQQAVDGSMLEHTEPSGSLTVAAPEAFLNSVLQPLVLPFLQQYPQIQLKLRAADGAIDVFKHNIDVAFRLTDKPDENLVLREICKTNLVLCASPQYLAERGYPTHPTELVEHDCLYLAETDRDNLWEFLKGDDFHRVAVTGRYAVNHAQMRLNAVHQHLGIGIFHDFVVRDALAQGSAIKVLGDWTLRSNYYGAIAMQYPQTKYMPMRLRVFIDFVLKHLAVKA